jgi:hypothetical protein
VLCLIFIAHPLPLFFCPIVLGIVIVCNADGQPEEQGGGRTLPCLRSRGVGGWRGGEEVRAHHRTNKKRKKAAAPAEPAAVTNNPSTATPMPSTAPAMKKDKTTGKKKAAKPVDLRVTPMWANTTNGATSHPVVAIAHRQKWVVNYTGTINGDVADKPPFGHQWYQKGRSSKRIAPGNPDFADMLWGRTRPTSTRAEGNKVGEGGPTKNNNQPSMGAVQ